MLSWRILIVLCVFHLDSGRAAPAPSPAVMTFATGYSRESLLYRRFEILYTDAFRRLGMTFQLNPLPKDEALEKANLGLVDGDTSRVQELELRPEFAQLLRVNVITNRSHHVAFTKNRKLKVASWEEIKAQNLAIAYPRGQIYATHKIKEFQITPGKALAGEDCEQLMSWLDSGRIDLYIDNMGNCWDTRRSERFKDIRVAAILGEDLNYPYLHKKHKDLVPRFAAALKASLADPALHAQLSQLEQEGVEKRGPMITVHIYTPYDFEPFVLDRSLQTGLIYDFQRFLNTLGDGVYHFVVQSLPRIPVERLRKMREVSIVPFVAPGWFNDEGEKIFDWSLPLIDDENVIVSSKAIALESLTAEKLKGRTLCGSTNLRRDSAVQKFIEEGIVKQTLTPNTGHCLQMIAAQRADFYVSGRMLINYHILQRPELLSQLHLSVSPVRRYARRVLITPKGTDLLPWLNERIESLGKSPAWRDVMQAYQPRP